MTRVKVIGLKSDLPRIVEKIHEYGGIELGQFTDSRLNQYSVPEYLSNIMEQVIRLRGIENHLIPQKTEPAKPLSLKDALNKCEQLNLDSDLNKLAEGREGVSQRIRNIHELKKTLEYLVKFKIDPKIIESNSLAFYMGTVTKQKLGELEKTLPHISPSIHFLSREVNKFESIVVMAVDRNHRDPIENELKRSGFTRITLPKVSGDPSKILSGLDEELVGLRAAEKDFERERLRLSQKHWAEIVSLHETLRIEEERLKASALFGETNELFVLEGWVRDNEVKEVSDIITETVGDNAIVQTIETNDEPPTVYNNPKVFNPFQDMIEFMALPKSSEIDPTMIFTLVFPIFYGMMLGDVGYGLLSLLLATAIIKKTSGLIKSLGTVWFYSAIPTIIFGVIYDEYLGFSTKEIFGRELYHAPLERIHNLQTLLVITILLGIIHVALGFLLGFVNEWREGNRRHALGKLGWIGIEISVVVAALVYLLNVLDPAYAVIIPVGFVGLVFVYRAEGVTGVVELPTLVSNILSYTRILAIGVSSLAIAMVINKLLLPDASSLISFAVKTPIFIFAHLGNLMLGMFESLVQAARLNYVEFFSKFYIGGGRRFNPFKVIRKHTLTEGR